MKRMDGRGVRVAQLVGAVVLTAGFFVALTPVGWALAHVSDAMFGVSR